MSEEKGLSPGALLALSAETTGVPSDRETLPPPAIDSDDLPPPPDEELPDYASLLPYQRPPVTHSYDLSKGSRTPWLVLTMSSLAPSPKQVPIFFAGRPIKGTVELNLEKPEHFTSVEVEVSYRPTEAKPIPSWLCHLPSTDHWEHHSRGH
jgi:hypothetical protein